MRSSRRPNRARAFTMVDALVGILLLALTAVTFASGFSTVAALGREEGTKIPNLQEDADETDLAAWF